MWREGVRGEGGCGERGGERGVCRGYVKISVMKSVDRSMRGVIKEC